MEKKLNIKRIDMAMTELGLNQSGLSKQLDVSRAIVSAWMRGEKFPRPDKLLALGMALKLPFKDIVEKTTAEDEPVVAFRKKRTRKTTNVHLDYAKEMGRLLESLVPFIPFDRMFQPPALKEPRLEYDFIQKAAQEIRQEIGVKNKAPIEFDQLIEKINGFDVILIPVFHGSKENHENALHIFLPASRTTWIYLNLDSHEHDFKFWMAHELGHVIAPSMKGETAEDFADAFAQALLFPLEQAEEAYQSLRRIPSLSLKISKIVDLSLSLTISPITIYMAVNSYAKEMQLPQIFLSDIYPAATNLNKACPTMSHKLAGRPPVPVSKYIAITKDAFHSPFFDILRNYLSNHEKSAGFIQSILDTSLLDAKEIHAELVGEWEKE